MVDSSLCPTPEVQYKSPSGAVEVTVGTDTYLRTYAEGESVPQEVEATCGEGRIEITQLCEEELFLGTFGFNNPNLTAGQGSRTVDADSTLTCVNQLGVPLNPDLCPFTGVSQIFNSPAGSVEETVDGNTYINYYPEGSSEVEIATVVSCSEGKIDVSDSCETEAFTGTFGFIDPNLGVGDGTLSVEATSTLTCKNQLGQNRDLLKCPFVNNFQEYYSPEGIVPTIENTDGYNYYYAQGSSVPVISINFCGEDRVEISNKCENEEFSGTYGYIDPNLEIGGGTLNVEATSTLTCENQLGSERAIGKCPFANNFQEFKSPAGTLQEIVDTDTYDYAYDSGSDVPTISLVSCGATREDDSEGGCVDINYAPVLALIDPLNVNEGETLTLNLEATDQNTGESLVYSYECSSVCPALMSIEDNVFKYEADYGLFDDLTITFKVSDGEFEDTKTTTITALRPEPMTATFSTTLSSQNIQLWDVGVDSNYIVDWGDGTSSGVLSTTKPSHIYVTPADYQVKIYGKFTIKGEMPSASSRRLISFDSLGKTGLTSMKNMFYKTDNLTSLNTTGWDTSRITNMNSMFKMAIGLTSLDLSDWDTSNVTDMSDMFYSAEKLTTVDVSNWNTSNVISMNSMFSRAKKITSLDVSNWDTSKVTSMSNMFSGLSEITELNVTNWDTSNLTQATSLFSDTSKLESLDVSKWNTSKIESTSGMFSGASALTYLDLSLWDMSSNYSLTYMFNEASSLTYLNLSGWTIDPTKFFFFYSNDMLSGTTVKPLCSQVLAGSKLGITCY